MIVLSMIMHVLCWLTEPGHVVCPPGWSAVHGVRDDSVECSHAAPNPAHDAAILVRLYCAADETIVIDNNLRRARCRRVKLVDGNLYLTQLTETHEHQTAMASNTSP